MSIVVNGEPRTTAATNLLDLWREETGLSDADPRKGYAIALNGELVPHHRWESMEFGENDRVEIVRAMQGG